MITLWITIMVTTAILFYRFKNEVKNGRKKPSLFDNVVYFEGMLMVLGVIFSVIGFCIFSVIYLP